MADKIAFDELLGATARWTAAVRARESVREDRLFDDPWAAALAGQEGEAWIEGRSADSVAPIALRTRFFDDFLRRITLDNAIRQVVLMAAGLDTRAYRLNWPAGTRLFELDQSPVLTYKEQILRSAGAQPACERQAIEADLTAPWQERLVQGGFDPGRPSGWLLEGFLFYLSDDSLVRILDEVTGMAAPGSWLGFDVINRNTLTSPWTRQWIQMQADSGAPWMGSLDDPEGFLATRGWQASLTQPGEEGADFGRWTYPVIPRTMPGMPRNWYVVAHR
jgi:methyltransferase (TIGR00027 family)